MDHYKSWGTLKKWLEDNLCYELKTRVSFFLTRYHKVHNSYGRAAITVDGKEWVLFSWIEMYHQEAAVSKIWHTEEKSTDKLQNIESILKPQWDENCTYCEWDFLSAVLQYRNMSIQDALNSDDFIIKILAIMDRRIGKQTLKKIEDAKDYFQYPDWVKQFYLLRFACENPI